jgi:hypothetical protein
METKLLERHFTKMGARVKVSERPDVWRRRPYSIDIGQDHEGEYFFLRLLHPNQHVEVLHLDAASRHLVLMVKNKQEKAKFLCGHDERHWFVAAIPEDTPVTTVKTAKEALKPKGLPAPDRWVRQGEWFFVRTGDRHSGYAILHNEPLVRRTRDGRGGKPHIATECRREGGTKVWVNQKVAPQGFTQEQYDAWRAGKHQRELNNTYWQTMVRDATVFVRGEIRHPDHKTLKLGTEWHRENESLAMASMVFLD